MADSCIKSKTTGMKGGIVVTKYLTFMEMGFAEMGIMEMGFQAFPTWPQIVMKPQFLVTKFVKN
jgi:hypothetical protein